MGIKRILLLFPLVLLLCLGLALVLARRNFNRKVNQLVLSSIGDAEKLNPILSVDSASGDINGFVFNGLVKYNENQELVGDLARHWRVEQFSSLYLRLNSGVTAEGLAAYLRAHLGDEGLLRLQIDRVAAQAPHLLQIHLTTAGRAFEPAILNLVPPSAIEPVRTLHIALDTRGRFADGTAVEAETLRRRLLASIQPGRPLANTLLDAWAERSDLLMAEVAGDEQPVVELVKRLLGPPGHPLGWRLEKVEHSAMRHRPVVTFYLRRGVHWHDGIPFSATDVLFTYERIMDERTNTVRRPNFEPVRQVEVINPLEVRVTYKRPFSPSLESWAIGIIPRHLLQGQDINNAPFNRHPIGTGPFRFKDWVADEQITLVANPDYFEGRPYLDQISYRIIPEPPLAELEFVTGGVDYDAPQPHQFARIATDRRFQVYRQLANAYTYIGWNLRLDLFKEVQVRQALAYAIDRQEIVRSLLYSLGTIATGPFPPQMWYSNPQVRSLPYDPARARQLLAQAGWRDTDGDGLLDKAGRPFRFVLMTNNGNELRKNVAVLVQRQLRTLGIQVDIELYEWSVFIRDKINPRNFEATVLGWSLGLDPDIYEIWHSSQREKGFNFVGYQNPQVDALIEQGRTEFDRERRRAIYFKIHELIAQDQPYTFLYVPEAIPALPRGAFKIRRPSPDKREQLEEIQMTKNGLLYFLNWWYRLPAPQLIS